MTRLCTDQFLIKHYGFEMQVKRGTRQVQIVMTS